MPHGIREHDISKSHTIQNKKIALNKCKWVLDDGKGNRGNEHAQLKLKFIQK